MLGGLGLCKGHLTCTKYHVHIGHSNPHHLKLVYKTLRCAVLGSSLTTSSKATNLITFLRSMPVAQLFSDSYTVAFSLA